MKIGICDDESQCVAEISSMLNCYASSAKCSLELKPYCSVSEANMEEMKFLDILFLDIEMPEIDGIKIMQFLELHQNVLIIFVSSHSERIEEAFGKNVIGFLTKPVQTEKLLFLFNRAMALKAMESKMLFIDGQSVRSDEIIMIGADHVYSRLFFTDQQTLLVRKNLCIWEEELKDYDFFKVHKSYLINLYHIETMGAKSVKMKNLNEKIPISRGNRKLLLEEYKDYCSKMLKY